MSPNWQFEDQPVRIEVSPLILSIAERVCECGLQGLDAMTLEGLKSGEVLVIWSHLDRATSKLFKPETLVAWILPVG